MANQYPFAPLVTFNMYISAFEDRINAYIEPPAGTTPVVPIAVDYVAAVVEGGVPGEINLRLPPSPTLLEELRNGAVVRIENIPLIHPSRTLVDLTAWDEEKAREESEWALARDPFTLSFSIAGLDENQRYFLFAETLVERYTVAGSTLHSEDPLGGELIAGEYGLSVPTPLTGDVTIGTPQVPGPGEVDPSAPSWVNHCRDTLPQTDVTLYWEDIIAEDPNLITVEYEIIRVSNTVLDLDALVDELGNPLPLSAILATRNDAVAWRTNRRPYPFLEGTNPLTLPFLEEFRHGQPAAVFNLHSVRYTFDPTYRINPLPIRVAFTDRTLRPNSLYFYYVRTVRRVLQPDPTLTDADGNPVVHTLQARSPWVEESVTTPVVEAPRDLREEDGSDRPGFIPETQVLVSWTHPAMEAVTTNREPNETLVFEYQLRADGETWGDIIQVPVAALTNPNNVIGNRFYFMLRNLNPGTNYQMRVRLTDRATGDTSVWSNVLHFITGWDDSRFQLERETDNWLEHLRRLLLEQIRQPFWVAVDTPDLLRVVYRPDAFRALADAPGTAIPLHNTNARTSVYYLPVSGILEANDHRKGFSASYNDMDILFAPRFLNQEQNRAITEMARNVSNRNINVNDYFVRITLERQTPPPSNLLHGNPPLGGAVDVRIDLVGVNTNVRNVRTWDTNMTNRAAQIIDDRAANPIIRQNIFNLVERSDHNGERGEYLMLDYLATVEEAVAAEISRQVMRDIPLTPNSVGIIASQRTPVTAFDAPMHIVSTGNAQNMSVNAFSQVRAGISPEWHPLPTAEHANGTALTAQAPGLFVFSGRAIHIPGIETVPHGNAITSLAARFGLASLFQDPAGIDLHRNATRHEVVGSVARLAGAPPSADAISWVASNMNVTLANRNGNGPVSQQEAAALVMALYENKTNTRVSSIVIRNHANTAGMTLDSRYAQAVRAAFELGIVRDLQPDSPATVGDLFNMLAALDGRIGL
jgi:hypothetical protein